MNLDRLRAVVELLEGMDDNKQHVVRPYTMKWMHEVVREALTELELGAGQRMDETEDEYATRLTEAAKIARAKCDALDADELEQGRSAIRCHNRVRGEQCGGWHGHPGPCRT